LKDFSVTVVFLIVTLFVIVAIVFSPNVNVGFAVSSLYPGYALPLSYVVNSFLVFPNVSSTISRVFDVSDTVIYRYGYVSYDGQPWTPFTLTTSNVVSGDWIYTKGTASISFTLAQLRMSLSRNVSNNTFVVVYSCSRTTSNAWDCHDGWQITKFDAMITVPTSPALVCTPNVKGCLSTTVFRQCNSVGSTWVNNNCPTGQTCSGAGICSTPALVCGDGVCNNGETCSSCPGDCGTCVSSLNTFYIDPNGVDSSSRSGSVSLPWKTLAYACSQVKTSGSVIHVNQGTYTETQQCVLAPRVSIEGVGASSVIKSAITSAPTIYLYSSSVTNGNQHISGIKMDGNNLAAYEPLVIDKRSNVEVHDCAFINFYFSGVSFYGEDLGDDVPPNDFCLNNTFYNNMITNCASFNVEGSPGNLQIDGQQGMRVYNNVITQTARGAGADGFGLKCVQGLNKDLKIYNNTITIDNDDETQFDFAMEFWDSLGGIEIYDNRIQGVVDLAGHFGRKGSYPYTYSVHDNILGPDVLKTTSRHGIYIENTNDLSDIYIYNNMFQNLNNPIKIETWSTASFSNIQIYYNVFYNIGTVGGGWNTNGFCEGYQSGYTLDNLKFYNNVFIAAIVAGANPNSAIQIPGKGTTTNVEIKNNIIMNFNSAISTGYSGGTIKGVIIANNIFYNNGATISWAGTVPTSVSESNTIISNPSFTSPTDFHLNPSSPAINAGINVGLTSDYDGYSVPYGIAPDIGAYEYRP